MRVNAVNNVLYAPYLAFAGSKKAKGALDPDKVKVIKPDDVEISKEEKAMLIQKVEEAHELAVKNYSWGNISNRGYATNVGLENGVWHTATNFNNTRNNVSAVCGERSAILGAYNDLLKLKPVQNFENAPLDFKVKYLAMSSYKPLGEDKNAASSCAECLSWYNTLRYFDDNTLLASLAKDDKDDYTLVLSKVSEYLPQRSELVSYPKDSIANLPVKMSKSALMSVEEKNIDDKTIRKMVQTTKDKYDKNEMSDISGQNAAASVLVQGKIYTGTKTDFSKRWSIEPLEFAFAKSVEENGRNSLVDALCYIGDEKVKNSSSLAPDRLVDVKVLGELSTRFANPKTLVITTRDDYIDVKTINDYTPDSHRYIQGYNIKL